MFFYNFGLEKENAWNVVIFQNKILFWQCKFTCADLLYLKDFNMLILIRVVQGRKNKKRQNKTNVLKFDNFRKKCLINYTN